MTITLLVVAVAVIAAAIAFLASATSTTTLDPLDTSDAERGVRQLLRRSPRLRRFARQRLDRTTAGGLLLTVSFGVLFGSALVVGVLLDMIDEHRGLARLDDSVARWGAEHATTFSIDLTKAITQFGARPVVIGLLLAVAVVDRVRTGHNETVAFVAIVALGEMLITNGLKLLVARERPDVMRFVHASGYSFPSGHSSAAAAAWAAAALVLSRNRTRRTRASLGAVAVLVAVAVAASRALLGVHWLTDVIAGLAIGWGWFLLVAIAFGGRRQRLGAPVEQAVPAMRTEPVTEPPRERTSR